MTSPTKPPIKNLRPPLNVIKRNAAFSYIVTNAQRFNSGDAKLGAQALWTDLTNAGFPVDFALVLFSQQPTEESAGNRIFDALTGKWIVGGTKETKTQPSFSQMRKSYLDNAKANPAYDNAVVKVYNDYSQGRISIAPNQGDTSKSGAQIAADAIVGGMNPLNAGPLISDVTGVNPLQAIGNNPISTFAEFITSPETWIRIGEILAGIVVVGVALAGMVRSKIV